MKPLPKWFRSEERRVGKSVDHCVTGVQTCALPISLLSSIALISVRPFVFILTHPASNRKANHEAVTQVVQIGRASCREKCRSLCDWSSDVCSSDLLAFFDRIN